MMNCEMPSLFREDTPVARKEYECCECHNAIAKGERHSLCSGRWNGEFSQYRTCLPCSSLRNKLCSEAEWMDEGPYIGGVHEYLLEDRDERLSEFEARMKKRSAGLPLPGGGK